MLWNMNSGKVKWASLPCSSVYLLINKKPTVFRRLVVAGFIHTHLFPDQLAACILRRM